MPVSAETLRLLMDAGVEGDDLLRIVESIDRSPTKERSANAERQARHRAKKTSQRGVISNVISNATDNVTPHVRVEDNLQTKETSGQERKKTAREDQAEFESELSSLLDAERVQALVAVRQQKRGKLNAHAARLLIAKINACGLTPAEAADTMALRNWISIEPEWLRRDKPNSTAPPQPRNAGELARMRLNGTIEYEPGTSTDDRRLDTGNGERQAESTGLARRFAVSSDILGRA